MIQVRRLMRMSIILLISVSVLVICYNFGYRRGSASSGGGRTRVGAGTFVNDPWWPGYRAQQERLECCNELQSITRALKAASKDPNAFEPGDLVYFVTEAAQYANALDKNGLRWFAEENTYLRAAGTIAGGDQADSQIELKAMQALVRECKSSLQALKEDKRLDPFLGHVWHNRAMADCLGK
jgi:hypothetical protein